MKPNCATNRAARIIRNGSSANDTSAGAGVISSLRAKAPSPSYGSTNSIVGSRIAIALTVKSRRTRSSSRLSPNATTGLRVTPSYASAR